jgi:hypothetical protein
MTISIEPTDFGQDILDSISPLLGAFGLLGSDGKLDINDWSLEKALGVFGTYERTEFILNLLSGYISSPTSVYREISSGLIVDKSNFSPDKIREEEWFPVSKGEGWSANIVVHHNKLGVLPSSTESAHTIDLGLGVHLDEMKFSLTSGDLLLSGHLAVPLIQITNKESGGTYVVADEIPEINCERLIWDPTGEPLSRIALSASLKPESGRFGTTVSAEAISLKSAFGKPYTDPNDPSKTTSVILKLALLDFIAQANSPSSTLEVDLIEAVSGGMANVLEQVIPAIVELLPNDAQLFVENILPMLGLIDSDWSTLGGSPSAPNWPRIAVLPLVDELQNNPSQAWDRVRNWLLELANAEVANQWLTHLSNLLFDSVSQSGIVGGSCTQSDPARLKFLDLPGISADLLIALWEDPTGNKMLDTGLRFSANKTLGGAVDVEGGLTAWVASIPITGGGSVAFLPELVADFFIDGDGNNPLFDQTVGGGETGSPLDNLHVKIQQARLGVSVQRSGVIDPLVELIDVDIGSSPVNHYDQIDLTSGASVMDAIAGVLDTILDTVSDALAENDVLQWLGSLVGLVAPRDGTFRTDWEGAGSAGDLRIDIMRMIQNPKDEITDYYARLLETDIDPYGQGSMPAWVYVQEAFVLLINTALAGPMKIDKPSMPTGQATVLGDGSPSSPWRTMIGQEGDIPGFNFFTCIEPTDTTGVNRLTFGFGCLVSLLHLRRHLHLETNVDVGLISLKLAEVAVEDVSAEAKLLPRIDATMKLHDAIVYSGDEYHGTAAQIPLFTTPSLVATVDAFSINFNWINGDGFGFSATVGSPRIGSIAPDFSDIANQLSDIRSLAEFSWGPGGLLTPMGYILPNLDSFSNGGNDNPIPENIQYQSEDGSTINITIQWDFHGLSCPKIGFDTRNGIFGLIDYDGQTNSLFDLLPNENIIQNEGVKMILGHFLATKGGNVGFFMSTFFRINPHLIHLDLGRIITRQGFRFSSDDWAVTRHPDWLSYYPNNRGIGLGPFSLPYDWPMIDWPAFINQPIGELNRFIVDIIHKVSASGEPFVIPMMRWLAGFVYGVTPDLQKAGLGWPILLDDEKPVITYPDIPITVSGDGTYSNPYSINLQQSNAENTLEFLVWIGPDGPVNESGIESVLTPGGKEIFDILLSTNLDLVELNYESEGNWAETTAQILVNLANFSQRTKSAIGDKSLQYIASSLMEFDQCLKTGDGISPIQSQQTGNTLTSSWMNRALGTHHDAILSADIIANITDFVIEHTTESWSPLTGLIGNQNICVVLISPNPLADWEPTIESISSQFLDNQSPPEPIHADNLWSITFPEIDDCEMGISTPETTIVQGQQSGIVTAKLSSRFSSPFQSYFEGMKEQILETISLVTGSGVDKVIFVAHSTPGAVLIQLAEDEEISENEVLTIMTVNSPNNGTILEDASSELKYIIGVLLSLSHGSESSENSLESILSLTDLHRLLSDLMEVRKSD